MASQQENNKSYSKLVQICNAFKKDFPKVRKVMNVLKKEGDINFKIPPNSLICSIVPKFIGCTILHIAAMKNEVAICKILLNKGADVTIQNQEGCTALHYVVHQHNEPRKLIHFILSKHLRLGDPTNPCDPDGLSHFHIACLNDRADAVEFFLNYGIPIDLTVNANAKKYAGYTSLHFAAKGISLQVIPVLLKHEAKINVKDARGLMPIHIFLDEKIKVLEYYYTSDRKLPGTAIAELDKIMNLLLDSNDVDDIGLTQLHVACIQRDTSVAEFFLEQDVDIDQPIKMDSPIRPGYTALHFAVHCNLDIVKILMNKNANYLAKDANGKTPMDLIWEKCKHEDICRIFQQKWKYLTFCDRQTNLLEFIKSAAERDKMSNYLENATDIMTRIGKIPACLTGRTILHFAVLLCRSSDLIDVCIERGLSLQVDIQDANGSTPIHLAFRMNKIDIVKMLMTYCKGDRNLADEDELSYLHIACAIQSYDQVKRLCKDRNNKVAYCGRSTYGLVTRGSTALHVAIASENSQIIEELLRCGLHLEATDASGQTPLYKFLRLTNNVDSICKIILYHATLTDQMLKDVGLTRLHLEIYAKDCDVCQFINHTNIETVVKCEDSSSFMFPYDGYTPLHMAIKIGAKDEVVKSLLNQDANLLAKNRQGDTPLYFALTQNPNCKTMIEIVKRLKHKDELRMQVEEMSGITMLHLACYMVNKDAVSSLLIGRFDVNAKVKSDCPVWSGCTPLHVLMKAIEYKVSDDLYYILEMILTAGADVTTLDGNNETAIQLSMRESSNKSNKVYTVVEKLVKKLRVFNVNPVDQNGMSHFHAACLVNNVEVVKSFMDNGVDINQPIDFSDTSFPGDTPLHLAVDYRTETSSSPESKRETVQLLLTNGADIKAENSLGQTAFHKAMKSSIDVDILEQFVDLGAAFDSKDIYEQTPLELLLQSENVSAEKIKFFKKYGCRLNDSNPLTEQGFMSMFISQYYHPSYKRIPRGATSGAIEVVIECRDIMLEAFDASRSDDMGRYLIHNLVTTSDPFCDAIDHYDLIEQFQSAGIDVDFKDKKGKTPLHLAAQFGNLVAVNALIDNGADINVLDATNKTPLNYAMEYHKNDNYCPTKECNAKIIERLISHLRKLEKLNLEINRNNIIEKQRALHRDVRKFFYCLHDMEVAPFIKNAKTLLVVDQPNLFLIDFFPEIGKGVISYPFISDERRDIVDKFFLNYNGESKDVCRLQYRKAVKRVPLLKLVINSMCKIAEKVVPIVCIEMIVQYLTNCDLKHFIKATADFNQDIRFIH